MIIKPTTLFDRCVNVCIRILMDNPENWVDYEDECRVAVNNLSKGKVGYFQPMSEALLFFGIDV